MSRALAMALRLGLAALLGYAGILKLLDPAAFAEEIANYRLLPALAPWLAAALPAVEVLAAAVLALGPRAWRAAAALLSLALFAVFTAAVGAAWLRGLDIRCGCFGKGGGPLDGLTVLRDVALVLWAAAVLRQEAAPAGR